MLDDFPAAETMKLSLIMGHQKGQALRAGTDIPLHCPPTCWVVSHQLPLTEGRSLLLGMQGKAGGTQSLAMCPDF